MSIPAWLLNEPVMVTLISFDADQITTTVLVTRELVHNYRCQPSDVAVVITYGETGVQLNGSEIMNVEYAEDDATIERICRLSDAVTMGPNPVPGTCVRAEDTYDSDMADSEAARNR
jgi:hypothetical protein